MAERGRPPPLLGAQPVWLALRRREPSRQRRTRLWPPWRRQAPSTRWSPRTSTSLHQKSRITRGRGPPRDLRVGRVHLVPLALPGGGGLALPRRARPSFYDGMDFRGGRRSTPDADATVEHTAGSRVWDCPVCRDEPDVVFFGESATALNVALARRMVATRADALLVAGSSLTVNWADAESQAAGRASPW
ncbi:hypothetical protein QJS66_01260 [Kocuria rhizophila]|nr:hypothetical protein QJS66_01260 [Kocuria rhizophila]